MWKFLIRRWKLPVTRLQAADVMAFGAGELQDKAPGHADEHLQLSFQLAYELSEAKDLQEACEIQGQFLVQIVDTYARQIQELPQLMTRFAPKAGAREGAI
jgi:hypothetical protein